MASLHQIKTALETPNALNDLIHLYSITQSEHTKNGKASMEIGSSRENDLKAVLSDRIGADFQADIDGDAVEDCRIGATRVSIKHISGKKGAAFKIKWTSDKVQANKFIDEMVALKSDYFCSLLLVYIDARASPVRKSLNTVDIVCVSEKKVRDLVAEMGLTAFKRVNAGKNNRGVEFSTKMMARMMEAPEFSVSVKDVKLDISGGAITRRMAMLSVLASQRCNFSITL